MQKERLSRKLKKRFKKIMAFFDERAKEYKRGDKNGDNRNN